MATPREAVVAAGPQIITASPVYTAAMAAMPAMAVGLTAEER